MSNGNSFSEYGGKCITTCGNYKYWSILIDTKPLYKKLLSKTMDFYYYIGGDFFCDVFQDFLFFVMEKFRGGKVVDSLGPIVFWNERTSIEYESEIYFNLYKARSYHLFGDFPKANKIYDNLLNSKDFKDDAIFFQAKILLQTKKFGELKEHIINVYDEYGEDIAARTGGNEIRYLFFIERYLEKFYLTEDWQLENIFNFTEPEINEAKTIHKELF